MHVELCSVIVDYSLLRGTRLLGIALSQRR